MARNVDGLKQFRSNLSKLMNQVFGPELDKCIVVYLDDLLVFSPTWEQHLKDVEMALRIKGEPSLREEIQMRLWCRSSVLPRFKIARGELQPEEEKLRAIKEWPTRIR